MSKVVERSFPAKSLLFGIRAIGYSFSTAVADIIDNSISAGAKNINVYSDPLVSNPYFCIQDDGCGMDPSELDNAMLFGSNRENKPDNSFELGRFGLGLKSASLSQCREFTVVSKKSNHYYAMAFDLDLIETENKLKLKVLDESEMQSLPKIEKLLALDSGTIVTWRKFDRIENSSKKFEDTFRLLVADSKKHSEMVFHRFYDDVSISYNDVRLERRDPFLKESHGRQQTGRTSEIEIDGSIIKIVPYTLPYANTLTFDEKKLLGNPKSIYDEQGLYLYRNNRLISWGNWMRMGFKSELNKLARIQIDIPSALDSVWELDVKKSSAKIPDRIKERIKTAINDSVIRSNRATKFPGVKEQKAEFKVWDRINLRDGVIKYQINRDIPAIATLYDSIGENEKKLLDIVLSQVESYLPKYSISNDQLDSMMISNTGDDAENETLIREIEQILCLADPEDKEAIFDSLLVQESYIRLIKKKDEIKRKVLGNGRS